MKNFNWKVRFNKNNIQFVFRFIAALLVPVLAYFGLNFESVTTWNSVLELAVNFISNPFLIGLTIYNAVNMIPDPTQKKLKDSKQAMEYQQPKVDEDEIDYL